MHIGDLLGLAVDQHTSDLHLQVPQPPVLRLPGDLVTREDLPTFARTCEKESPPGIGLPQEILIDKAL